MKESWLDVIFSLTSKSEFYRKFRIFCEEVVENASKEWYKNWRYTSRIVQEKTIHSITDIFKLLYRSRDNKRNYSFYTLIIPRFVFYYLNKEYIRIICKRQFTEYEKIWKSIQAKWILNTMGHSRNYVSETL